MPGLFLAAALPRIARESIDVRVLFVIDRINQTISYIARK